MQQTICTAVDLFIGNSVTGHIQLGFRWLLQCWGGCILTQQNIVWWLILCIRYTLFGNFNMVSGGYSDG